MPCFAANALMARESVDRARWQVVSPSLDQLRDTDVTERHLRLDLIRRDDHLLAVEIEALAAQEIAVVRDALLERSVLVSDAAADGETVRNYTLESLIGRGGMGSLWLARRSDGRYEGRASIKFLSPALMGRNGVERFRPEGDVPARLVHPNFAKLLHAGIARNGQPYLVLEYVHGAPIDTWCESRALSVHGRLRLFIDVLASVAHVHYKLILHRDLKPSSILVTHDGQVKLLDFGLVRLRDEIGKPAPPADFTVSTCQAYTPDFDVPEQVQRCAVTIATDVYPLGVLLYFLLSGRHPTAPNGATRTARLQAIVDSEPTRLSAATPRRADLESIVAKAVKKKAWERYPTATALAGDLKRYRNGEPVSEQLLPKANPAIRSLRRSRRAVMTAALVAADFVAGRVTPTRAASLLPQ